MGYKCKSQILILIFLVATLKKDFFKKAGKINFNHIFYLTQYVPQILISTRKQN